METSTAITARQPWNKGKLVGQKTPLKLKEIWAIRIRLQIASRCRDLALFNLAVDSKLLVSMPGLWIPGFFGWDWTLQTMVPIRYGGRRPHWLPTDKESEGCTVAPRPYQTREHRPISWY
jgi:hypothetical protein